MNDIAVLISIYRNDNLDDLKECINSLYNQSFKQFDIFVQEDGPVDENIDIFLTEELYSKRISYLGKRESNIGFDFSLNELLEITFKKGYKFFVRMDADDIAMSERIEQQFEFMDKHPNIDVVGTFIEEFSTEISFSKKLSYPLSHQDMRNFFKRRVPLAHVTAFFRKTFFDKAGFYETDGHLNNGDTLLWMKGFNNGCNFANINYIGVRVRVSKEFFERRGGLKKAYCDFRNRIEVINTLNYSPLTIFFAIGSSLIILLPRRLKKLAYLYLRK